jgi:hypothetical protein
MVNDYFEKTYKDYLDKFGRRGLSPNLPCVQVGKTNPKFLPLEVITILEDQYSMKKLRSKHQATKVQSKSLIGVGKSSQTDYLKCFDLGMNLAFYSGTRSCIESCKSFGWQCEKNK